MSGAHHESDPIGGRTGPVPDASVAVASPDRSDPVDHRPPLILGGPTFHEITDAVARPLERPPTRGWWFYFLPSLALLGLLGVAISWLFWEGIGVWGLNNPVGWAFDITNFVFWVGIGHAGTLISAILFLFRQKWRTSINRSAEAMTLFAVLCALIFPGIHVGRPWVAYWMFPLPNQMGMWPNFRSPLLWDVFAVSIYGTVSVLFWYVGLIPDLATIRDRAKTPIRRFVYGLFALGWRGSVRQWQHYESAYLILAALIAVVFLVVAASSRQPREVSTQGANRLRAGFFVLLAVMLFSALGLTLGRMPYDVWAGQIPDQVVYVTGQVRVPGAVPLMGNMTVMDALARAGSPLEDAGPYLVINRRGAEEGAVKREPERVSMEDLQSGQAQNIRLRDGDTIYVPKAETFFVTGYVKNPGPFVFDGEVTVAEAISRAGGVSERGSKSRLRITRIVDGKQIVLKNVKLEETVRPGDSVEVLPRFF